ncbi:SDR family NAD(P)-dependent oxidoreductase [Chryseobacterium sp. cx-311]|uniref:SDR family NAD(P)-dependent oxidoreductase n=1 Tax=Marnyiella aurantia TaxID=2758037 RepID=UPI001AE87DCE|nr:SDR family NAD(P)-dependent oxidoreductase [Marnyiella aurantia]MBP0612641.1 SDR family NAD(P)-dependent oxidoreductase [Marnyiella aurantia]
MIVLGSNSEVAQAFVEEVLQQDGNLENLYLFTSEVETAEKFARHLQVKYLQDSEIIPLDLTNEVNFQHFERIDGSLLFCAVGYMGMDTDEGLYDSKNTSRVLDINYSKLLPVLTYFAEKMERRRGGTLVVLSSVAGERGRQSNFIYGSAKAGLTAYLSGLRNYMHDRRVNVITVKPGFMRTRMTEGLPLNPVLTVTPAKAAKYIFRAYKKQQNVVYVLPVWRIIMFIIRHIPEFIFIKLKL